MENNSSGRFKHLLPILRKYQGYLWLGAVATIFANVLVLIVPYLVKLAFEAVEAGRPASEIFHLCLYMVILAVVGGVFRFGMRRTIIWASRKAEFNIRNILFEKFLSLDQSYYHNTKTGDLMAHSTNDVEAVRMMIGPGTMHILNAIVSVTVSVGFMVTLSLKMTVYAILPLILLSFVVNRIGTIVHRRFLVIQEHFSFLTTRVQENLAGVRVIKAYRREDSEIERFGGVSRRYATMNLSMARVVGLFHPMIFGIAGLVSLMILYVGGTEINSQKITLGTLVAFFGYLGWLTWPMMALGWVVSLYQRGMASLGRINKILNTKAKVEDPAVPDAKAGEIKGRIEFKNLTFNYPGSDDDEPVLQNIDLTIEPGMRVGLTGPTGSGKTTLVSLIPHLFTAESGQLFIDNIDVNLWPLKYLRRGVGFVPQETFLFSNTLENNIDLGNDRSDADDIVKVADLAALHKDVESFPGGYETILGERGITLSGGQKQRTALARAIIRRPSILILDDATSSVDTETEDEIFTRLQKVFPGRTSIIISHRVASLKGCDLIVYLEGGIIAEQGTHDELLARRGPYAALYRRQLKEAELDSM